MKVKNGIEIQCADRFGFVALAGGTAYKNGEKYSGWFYLTDLYVEEGFRAQGLGKKLVNSLELEISKIGVSKIWTWTAGYEASEFYQKQGYSVFTQLKNWYSDGSSRIGLKKELLALNSKI